MFGVLYVILKFIYSLKSLKYFQQNLALDRVLQFWPYHHFYDNLIFSKASQNKAVRFGWSCLTSMASSYWLDTILHER